MVSRQIISRSLFLINSVSLVAQDCDPKRMNSAGFTRFQYHVWRRHATFRTCTQTPLLGLTEEENDIMLRTGAQKK